MFPHAIILPRTAQEMAETVKLLKKHNLKFSLRSGGHCHEPGSLSSGYVIDLRNFDAIEPDFKKKEVFVGAGNHLGPVIEKLGKSDFVLATGTCGSNGFAGSVMGGGLGFLSRFFGATCDTVKNIQFVTAEGKIITVDKNHHPDLFWALRGAGNGSYGVALGYTCTIHFVSCVTILELDFGWPVEKIPAIMNAWQSWVATTLPADISAEVHFTYDKGKRTLSIIAFKLGKQPFNEWKKIFKTFKPHVRLKTERYLDAAKRFGDTSPIPFFKGKSKMLFKPLPKKGTQVIIEFFKTLHLHQEPFFVNFQIGAGRGKLAEGHTSYFPRKAFAWFFQFIYWNREQQTKRALEAINTFYASIAPFTSPFSYANIVDYDLGNDFLHAYYGDHVDRLIRIKNKYDPMNVFHWKQSIPTQIT